MDTSKIRMSPPAIVESEFSPSSAFIPSGRKPTAERSLRSIGISRRSAIFPHLDFRKNFFSPNELLSTATVKFLSDFAQTTSESSGFVSNAFAFDSSFESRIFACFSILNGTGSDAFCSRNFSYVATPVCFGESRNDEANTLTRPRPYPTLANTARPSAFLRTSAFGGITSPCSSYSPSSETDSASMSIFADDTHNSFRASIPPIPPFIRESGAAEIVSEPPERAYSRSVSASSSECSRLVATITNGYFLSCAADMSESTQSAMSPNGVGQM